MNGPLLSCSLLCGLEACEALEEAQDETHDKDLDAHEDVLDDALEADLFSRVRHHELAHIWAIILALSAEIGKLVA